MGHYTRVHQIGEDPRHADAAYDRVNVRATQRLAEAASEAGVRRLVFLSSVKAFGETSPPGQPLRPESPTAPSDAYGRSKLAAERLLADLARRGGVEAVVLRPPLVYGPGVRANFLRLARAVAAGWPLPLGAIRHNRRSLVGLANLVDLLLRTLTHPDAAGAPLLVSDDDDVSTAALIERTARAMGARGRLVSVPEPLLAAAAALLGRRAEWTRLAGSMAVDISETKRRLQWSPPWSMDHCLHHAFATPRQP